MRRVDNYLIVLEDGVAPPAAGRPADPHDGRVVADSAGGSPGDRRLGVDPRGQLPLRGGGPLVDDRLSGARGGRLGGHRRGLRGGGRGGHGGRQSFFSAVRSRRAWVRAMRLGEGASPGVRRGGVPPLLRRPWGASGAFLARGGRWESTSDNGPCIGISVAAFTRACWARPRASMSRVMPTVLQPVTSSHASAQICSVTNAEPRAERSASATSHTSG